MAKRDGWKTTRDEREGLRNDADAASVGWFIFVTIAVGFAIGHWVDGRFHIEPWGTMVGVGIGIAAGFRNLMKIANRMADEDKRKGKRP